MQARNPGITSFARYQVIHIVVILTGLTCGSSVSIIHAADILWRPVIKLQLKTISDEYSILFNHSNALTPVSVHSAM